ncbi:hypothetical protein CPB86DRAFT_693642, partial [Serendipita vermifera]
MLPAEICQMILRYAISVPEFLDPDYWVDQFPPWVIVNRGSSYSLKRYIKAETIRKSLRRVCRRWDVYLRQYAHRWVRMCDIVHGTVRAKYLRSAIRI